MWIPWRWGSEPIPTGIEANQPFVQPERRSGQVAPGAHTTAACPAGLLQRQQFAAAPTPCGRQILRLKVHPGRLLLGRVRWRRGRRNRRRGMEFRQSLVVPCSGAHIEQGYRRGSAGTAKWVPRPAVMKQGEELTAPVLSLLARCRQLHLEAVVGRANVAGDARPGPIVDHIAANSLRSISGIDAINQTPASTANRSGETRNRPLTVGRRNHWILDVHFEKTLSIYV